jgi:hypothetical protein
MSLTLLFQGRLGPPPPPPPPGLGFAHGLAVALALTGVLATVAPDEAAASLVPGPPATAATGPAGTTGTGPSAGGTPGIR